MIKYKDSDELGYLLYFNFLKYKDFEKIREILDKFFFKITPFGMMPDEQKIKILKAIYLKLKK